MSEIHKFDQSEFNIKGFNYVTEAYPNQKICFGSLVERSTAPIGKGLSPFQKRNAPEWFRIGPASYHMEKYTSIYQVLNKIRSKRGVAPLANKDQRFKDKIIRTPSPSRYDLDPKKELKQSSAPFGINAKIRTGRLETTPGPGSYNITKLKKCRRTRISSNFGKPKIINTVETRCIPEPVDRCQKCDGLCNGDYWHLDYSVFLCHCCWMEEKEMVDLYSKKELKKFKKLRNCSFMHRHEGTTAAIITQPLNTVTKKIRLENYLDLYIEC